MKRIISFVLCMSMLLSMVPVSVFASETEETAAAETFPVVETTEATEIQLPTEETAEFSEAAAAETAAAQAETSVPETVPETTAAAEVPETTEATVPQETEAEEIFLEYTYIPDEDFPDSDELFAAYVEQQFYGTEMATFGFAAGERLSGDEKLAYDALVSAIRDIASGNRSSAVISIGPNGEIPVSFTKGFYDIDLDSLLHALLSDLPYDLFWFNKTGIPEQEKYGINMSGSVSSSGKILTLTFSFMVSANYSSSGEEGTFAVDSAKIADVTQKVKKAAAKARAIVSENAHLSDYDKLVAYKDAICDLTSYNYPAANSGNFSRDNDPWQLVYVFDGMDSTDVVCEGYSKAFQYLCDLSEFTGDVTCYSVSGTTTGPHMWNIVSINGSNYLVDVTNSDTGKVGATGNLFLVGKAPNSNGSYTFGSLRYTYNSETKMLWGTGANSILSLASKNYTPSENSTPSDSTTPSVMTGADLVAAMESASGNYLLQEDVIITSDTTLPGDVSLHVYTPGSITVRDGATLTVPGSLGVANGGKLTVASGSTLSVNSFAIGGGTTCTINGTLINNRKISISYGSLAVRGTYRPAENAYLEADNYATVTGISKSLISLFTYVSDESSLVQALVPKAGYASQTAYLMGLDLNYDGVVDGPVTITGNITVPEGVKMQIGYFVGQSDTVILSDGARLTVDGRLSLISTSTLTIAEGAKLINNGTVSSSGTIVNNGKFKGNGEFNQSGTMEGHQYLTGNAFVLDNFLENVAEAEKTGKDLAVWDQITLTEDLTVNMTGELSFADHAKLTVANGATLTLNCPTIFSGSQLFVANDGSKLISNASLTVNNPHNQENGGKAFFLGSFENNGALWITTGAYVDITGSAVSNGRIFVADDGSGQLTINGQLDAKAYLCINEGGNLLLSQNGKLNLLGQGGGYLDNQGTAQLYGTVYIEGLMSSGARRDASTGAVVGIPASITTYGTVTATDTSSIGVGEGGNIFFCGPVTTAGEVNIERKGNLWVDNTMTVASPGVLNVNGNLHIDFHDDHVESNGILELNSTANVSGYLQVTDGGILKISENTVLNIKNDKNGCGYLDNHGHVDLLGTMNLDGLFTTGVENELINPADVNLQGSIFAGDFSSIGITAGGILSCFGPVTTTGEVNIELLGTLWVDNTVSITGSGNLTIDGALHVNHFDDGTSAKGVLNVDTETHVNGYWAIHEGGTLTVGENATVGIYNNEERCGYLDNNGTMTLDGHLYLEGLCTTGAACDMYGNKVGGPASAEFNWYVDVTETGFFGVQEDGTVTLFGLNNYGEVKTEDGSTLIFDEDATVNNHGGSVSLAAETCDSEDFTVMNHLNSGSFGDLTGIPKANTALACTATSLDDIQAVLAEFATDKYEEVFIQINSNLTIDENITIPEDVSISLNPSASGKRSVLTIPKGVTVTNNGTITVNKNTVLVLLGTVGGNAPQDDGGMITEIPAHIEVPDFDHDFSEISDGTVIYGLWAGSKAVLSPVLVNELDEQVGTDGISITMEEGYDNFATVTEKNGSYTVTALSSLLSSQDIEILFEAEGFAPATVKFNLRPKAEVADIRLGDKIVTGSTVAVDVSGDDRSRQLSCVITPADAVPAGAEPQWSSSNKAVATVDATGKVTFTGEPGTVKITLTTNYGITKTAAVTFDAMALPQKLLPVSGTVTKLIGGKGASYSVTDEAGNVLNTKDVLWYFVDEQGNLTDSCPYATIKNGKLATKAVVDPYVVRLQAGLAATEGVAMLQEPITVTLYPAVSSVSIQAKNVDGYTLDMTQHQTVQLSAVVAPYAESAKSITWKSSKTTVATIDEKTGLLTLQGPGKTKITATVEALDGKKTNVACEFNVGTFVQDIIITAQKENVVQDLGSLKIFSGEKLTFSATTAPVDPTTPGVKWSVSADTKAYASINATSGILTAKNVTNPVQVEVICESKDGNCSPKTVTVKIQPKPVTVDGATKDPLLIKDANDNYLTKTTVTMAIGAKTQLSTSEDVQKWTSSKATVAYFEDGLLVAKAKGTAKITATAADGRTAEVTVKVVDKVAKSIDIIPKKVGDPFSVAAGKSLNLAAETTYTDNSADTRGKVTWSLENNTCGAKISTGGALSAPKTLTGPVTVTVVATSKDCPAEDRQEITIVPAVIGVEILNSANVDITNTTQTWDMANGDSFQLKANVFPAGAMDKINWKSSSKNVLVNEETGEITCVKPGTVTITATAADGSGKKASFKLTVTKSMSYLKLPASAFIGSGKSLTFTKMAGFEMDNSASNKNLIWTLTDLNGNLVSKNVATLSNKGVLKAGGKVTAPMEVVVQAAPADGGDLVRTCTVTIYPVTKGIALYAMDEKTNITGKAVNASIGAGCSILIDTTNKISLGIRDDLTADEFLPNGSAWEITQSPELLQVEFDGQTIRFIPTAEAKAGDTVKVTIKALDGSGKNAKLTVNIIG